jgi:peptide/nickel transport system substrate-binding protein
VLGSDAQSKAALEQNDLDAGRVMSLEALRDAQARNPRIIGWDPASPLAWNDPCARQLEVNTLREPWTNPRLRRAVSMLIDRQTLASMVYGGAAVPSRTLFPEYGGPSAAPLNAAPPVAPPNAGLRASIEAVVAAGLGVAPRADATAAAALLAATGWSRTGEFFQKDGTPLAVTIPVNVAQAQDVQIAREVARQLTAAGINARTSEVSNAEFWGDAIPKGNYEMALSWLGCGSVAEPYTSLARYAVAPVPLGVRSPGFNNTGRWGTQPARDFADIVTRELGIPVLPPAQVPPVVVRAYRHLSDEMPIIPLIQSPRIIPFNTTYWNGWPVRGGPGVPMHSWGSTHRIIHALRRAQ